MLALVAHIVLLRLVTPQRPQSTRSFQAMEVEIWVDHDGPVKPEEVEVRDVAEPGEVLSARLPERPRTILTPQDEVAVARGEEAAASGGLAGTAEEVDNRSDNAPSWEQIDPSRILGVGAQGEPLDPPRGPLRARGKSSVQQGIDQALAEFAKEVPHLSERPPPTLALQSDGSLRYQGAGIRAVIGPDGSLDFPKADSVSIQSTTEGSLERLFNKEKRRKWIEEVYGGQVIDCKYRGPADSANDVGCGGRAPSTVPVMSGIFDTCGLEPRDCYSYEKQWIMRETKKLREKLHQRWRQLNLRRSLFELEVVLSGLESDEKLGTAQKRARLQQLLADCADNWEGNQARLMIEDALTRLERAEYARLRDAGHSSRPDAGPG